ncbi:MAG TPA: adenylyl-sulfate kinase [Methylomirabilota bacterium]|nr:adenylyl-sulfate kinase [Methylomirabilota bacterium]
MSWAVWITGLPGSGKSVVARALASRLAELGHPAVVLELDAIRKLLTPSPCYTDWERDLVYRALVYMARTLTSCGIPAIIDATAHRRVWRDLARSVIPSFAEIQLVCPLDVCRAREAERPSGNAPSGIYAAAGQPGATVPGVDVPYEPALDPEIVVDTVRDDVPTAVASIVPIVLKLVDSSAQGSRQQHGAGWAMWVTGLPGSGKTTLASGVAEGLSALGVPVVLLELIELHDFMLGGRMGTPAEEDIVHRALVGSAKLLTDAGVPVVIDATARRREWRQLARQLIQHFAEVQLVCPPAICTERERVVRWMPPVCAQGGRRKSVAAAPDIVIAYEPALDAELTLYTDVRAVWSVVYEAIGLARRLHHHAAASRSATIS